MELFRVFPYLATAGAHEAGGALYVPPQGAGRLDNPEMYGVLYAGDAAAGAMAEAFGRFPEWHSSMLARHAARGGSVPALARYDLPTESQRGGAEICDLDDAATLLRWELRPSQVVTRDYAGTRAWARRLWQQRLFAGVRWWSYYDARWGSLGLWETRQLRLRQVEVVTLDHPALREAAQVIQRRIIG